MFAPFSHFLSFGSTDQQTLRALSAHYDGLFVPGTVAAFQKQGTGGLVLTLSASRERIAYVIDPRFPLFQQHFLEPKKSHLALAQEFGDPSLISSTPPSPADFPDERIHAIALAWVEMNLTFRGSANEKFDKYAKRLGEPVTSQSSQAPAFVIAPYFAVSGIQDPWWERSDAFVRMTREAAGAAPVRRLICTNGVNVLDACVRDAQEDECVVWVSDLHELESTVEELAAYLGAIHAATSRGQRIAAAYGGFFAVLASTVGLAGLSHGIGYGEHRAWLELPQSGPPPARYYIPALHRYVQQDLAQTIWERARSLGACSCDVCRGRPPVLLDYHELMQHSVLARRAEIEEWADRDPTTAISRLRDETAEAHNQLEAVVGGALLSSRVEALGAHLFRWLRALEIAAS